MTAVRKKNTLEIDENVAYQAAFWKVQRVGWLALVAFLMLAVFGLLGGEGIANNRSVGSRQFGVETRFEPYLHRDASTELTATLFDAKGGSAHLFISHDYLDKMQIKTVVPEPRSVRAVNGGYLYVFDAQSKVATASFYFWPDNTTLGAVKGQVGPSPEKTVSLNQWVYP